MIIAGLLLSLAAAPETPTTLWRGLPVSGQVGYWAVQDTFLDAASPDSNYGGDPLLSAGPGKAILIRYADFARLLPAGHQITEATLELRPILGGRPLPSSTALVVRAWNEGPDRRGPKVNPVFPPQGAKSIQDATTFNQAQGGLPGLAWGQPGAKGVADVQSIPLTARYAEDGTLLISGLGEWAQRHIVRPDESFGLRLEFSEVVDFASSEFPDPAARPRLMLSHAARPAPGNDLAIHHLVKEGNQWTAEVGANSTARARATWVVDGEERPGQEVELGAEPKPISIQVPGGARAVTLRLEGNPDDPNPSNNVRTSTSAAIPVFLFAPRGSIDLAAFRELAREAEQTVNETVLPHSRFSFAPAGSRARIRLQGVALADPAVVRLASNARFVDLTGGSRQLSVMRSLLEAAGLPDLASQDRTLRGMDPFRGLMGWGDTRNDIDLPTILGFLREPWFDPLLSAIPAPSTDLLSASDVAILDARTKSLAPDSLMPKSVIFRCLDGTGRLVPQATIRMVGGEAIEVRDGLARIPESFKWTSNEYVVELTGPSGAASVVFKKWQLIDSFARGNTDSAILTLRFNVPVVATNRDVNLALNRLVFLPSEIKDNGNAMTDGDSATGITWPANLKGTLELDLGKDRSVTAIDLVVDRPTIWSRLQILASETGESGNPETWVIEPFGNVAMVYRGEQEGSHWRLSLHGLPSRARSLKIVVQQGAPEPVNLKEVRVFGAAENRPGG